MRVVLAILGLVLSLPSLLFFGIASQTLLRAHERWLAITLTVVSIALLGLSAILIFNPKVQALQLIALAATLVLLALAFALAKGGV